MSLMDERWIAETNLTEPPSDFADGCFYCGKPMESWPEHAYIDWLGMNGRGMIYLHPMCALEMCLRVLRDFHEWENRTWRQRGQAELWEAPEKPLS